MDAQGSLTKVDGCVDDHKPRALGWRALPVAARLYVAAVMLVGAYMIGTSWPLHYPRPVMFGILILASCLTSAWKVNLPGSLSSGSTLSVSYAADLAALMLLGPEQAVVVALAGVLTQCTVHVRQPYPLYRTAFSVAAEAITILSTGLAYTLLGGTAELLSTPALPKAIAGTIVTYFLVNSALMAGAIGLSTRRSLWRVWRDDLLWSGPSFVVAGAAGALAAVTIERGDQWSAMLMAAPIYLTYRTYRIYLGRIEDEQRHLRETQRLHREALEALSQAQARRAGAGDREGALGGDLAQHRRRRDRHRPRGHHSLDEQRRRIGDRLDARGRGRSAAGVGVSEFLSGHQRAVRQLDLGSRGAVSACSIEPKHHPRRP